MPEAHDRPTLAKALIAGLEARGIDTVFGIPGVHTIALYGGLENSGLRHVTPRHEQGSGFMADGYARAVGKPAACFIITGPGMTNIATAMAQARADSVPMLVIGSVQKTAELGLRQGRLHELPDQQATLAGVAAFSHRLLAADNLFEVLDRAFAVFAAERPGPAYIEIPRDLFDAPVTVADRPPSRLYRAAPDPAGIQAAADALNAAERPLLLLGGGAIAEPDAIRALAERLDTPTLTTINARGVLGRGHPLDLGANASWPAVRRHAHEADVILAIGTELGETDYDVVFDGGFVLAGTLIHIDLDPAQLAGAYPVAIGLVSDAASAARALTPKIADRPRGGAARVAALYAEMNLTERADLAPFVSFFDAIERAAPNAVLVGDSTAPVYAGNVLVHCAQPRHWFNSSTGYGTLGYALPAAIGAKRARPDQHVITLVGDGGLMFTIAELATAVDEDLPITVIVWHNQGYEEIRRSMDDAEVSRCGVDIAAPDFQTLAAGFGIPGTRVADATALQQALRDGPGLQLIEVDAGAWPKTAQLSKLFTH
ncbi:5-guanidino-2-oxopentanoate decarboxylase [Salinisphaera aquimarina]|uniref:5-guanidino-2-oxopentanoate decarboxylase n=1 Tax=Salinisphaera aquimarina TaxID=2094031 RepID=A0ABV7EKC2_9GAMM